MVRRERRATRCERKLDERERERRVRHVAPERERERATNERARERDAHECEVARACPNIGDTHEAKIARPGASTERGQTNQVKREGVRHCE